MAYNVANPPILRSHAVADKGQRWVYASTDNAAAVAAAGYFTNGKALGMKLSDILENVDTDAAPVAITLHIVTAVNATTGAVTVSAGSAIGV